MSRRSIVALGLLAMPVVGLAACNALLTRFEASHAETVRTLKREARALVPLEARLVHEEESACVELRSYPSCVIVFFEMPGTREVREVALEDLLRERGWAPAPGAPSFVYRRDGLRASVSVRPRAKLWEHDCANELKNELDRYQRDRCLDSVLVSVT